MLVIAVEADDDLDPVAAATVDVVVVPDPGFLDGDVEVDLLVDLLDPDVAVGVVLDEQLADQAVASISMISGSSLRWCGKKFHDEDSLVDWTPRLG